MKKYLVTGFLLIIATAINAHPGIGIVKDSKGNIYYTDLKQVWKITPGGKKTIAVRNVHSHEIFIDQQDNLYGEHLWYNGEKLNTWGHYAWCLKNNGEFTKEIEQGEGFLENYSFVRDSSGNMYSVERFTITRFKKKTKEGKISTIAEGKFGFIGWLYSSKKGDLYFAENNKLQKLSTEGKFSILAENIDSKTAGFTGMGRNYDAYGIWTDTDENIYIAMIGAKKVIRINPVGELVTVLYSTSLWTACSGLFDDNGNLWLLETSAANETRARMISPEELSGDVGSKKKYIRNTQWMLTVITVVMISGVGLLLRYVLNRKQRASQHLLA